MPLQDQPGIRKMLLAAAVALALSGSGAAIAWSADPPFPTPPSSQAAPGQQDKHDKSDKQDKQDKQDNQDGARRPQLEHSESVVKNADGTFATILEQRGTVETVSSDSITVKSGDGFSQTYAVTAGTRVTTATEPGDDGKRLRPTEGTIADITTGEQVRISGVKAGGEATAHRIAEGAGDVPGLGLGRGHGHGKGHARGHGIGKGHGQGNGLQQDPAPAK